ncbi:MAG: hypothetical protein GXO66_00445 [Euryarchaeota archaeon]|nr:hypothetical protein [Euryarchaeota archaeon]
MSTTSVYSVRIPKELRRAIEEMDDVDWQEEIRRAIAELVRRKRKERLLQKARTLRERMRAQVDAARLVREDRDAR